MAAPLHPPLQHPPRPDGSPAPAHAAAAFTLSDPSLAGAVEAGVALWGELLTYALTDPLMITDSFRQGSELHRKKVGEVWGG